MINPSLLKRAEVIRLVENPVCRVCFDTGEMAVWDSFTGKDWIPCEYCPQPPEACPADITAWVRA